MTTTTTKTTPRARRAGVVPPKSTDLEVAALPTRDLLDIVGGLSRPSKMPGWAYSLPARECGVGSRLREVEGSTCQHCYAMRGRYVFPNVQSALYRRFAAIHDPRWVDAMSTLILRKGETWFRWHDSGDIQSVDHLANIVEVARRTPNVRHWIPTRENRIVSDWFATATDDDLRVVGPDGNLRIRMSAHMIGGTVPTFPRLTVGVSTVTAGDPPPDAHRCPAPHQGNQCGDCRACWDPDIQLIDYALH